MLNSTKLLTVVSPFEEFFPVLELRLVLQDYPVLFDFFEGKIVSVYLELAVFRAIVNVLMGYVPPNGVYL